MSSKGQKKYVYQFGNQRAEGNAQMKPLLGGKGANLAEMSAIGLPVPPGFTISTEACRFYADQQKQWPSGMRQQVNAGIDFLEQTVNRRFGDPQQPLLVSVRSGAAVSMPGMMDTVLNLGLTDQVVEGLARLTGNRRFALDSYRRLIDMFGHVVMGIDHERFEEALTALKQMRGVTLDTELAANDLRELVERYKAIYHEHTGETFPQDPYQHLYRSIDAVFDSWNAPRAIKYRKINQITDLLGTGVNVQTMVFGNMGSNSGTGVCFTRSPSTGIKKLYGEYLINAQGEDVVGGIRTPEPIQALADTMPPIYNQLVEAANRLEHHYENMQDIEFTVQDGQLYILQTRHGKRTGVAALQIAVDMVEEGLTTRAHAVQSMVEPRHLEQLLHPRFEDETAYQSSVIGQGLPASPGAAVGQVVFSADEAEAAKEKGQKVILVRVETSPEDVGGMDASEGILTSRGGMTSHAAVVARGWGKPCVAGCNSLRIDYKKKELTTNGTTVRAGDWISINGTTGELILGQQPLVEANLSGNFLTFMDWVHEFQDMAVWANADTPEDARKAAKLGAEGIGLCRTEHMFFGETRIRKMREMILASDKAARQQALDQLLPFQREDFRDIFRAMNGYPVTIRLLDPPLHEFLPQDQEEQNMLARSLGLSQADVQAKIETLQEFNPMLGHRGCRLGISYPEITAMQTQAILEAAVELYAEGLTVRPEIMVPLVSTLEEFRHQKQVIDQTARAVFHNAGQSVAYRVGTMIEVPRAALMADTIAQETDFFSFGTNDLTQMTFGYSRDDAAKFLPTYLETGILPFEPFEQLDQAGVGQLVRWATKRGRQAHPELKVGICGEHGGNPPSVAFFYETGLDYVSCSPFRVPVARLAAAQASLASAAAPREENQNAKRIAHT